MTSAALLVLLLANQGYLLSDQDAQISLRWAVPDRIADAEAIWELSAGGARLSGGTVAVSAREGANITIRTPSVRVRTPVTFSYRIVQKGGNRSLERGRVTLHVYPRDLLSGLAASLGEKRLIVVDRESSTLVNALKSAGVPFDLVGHAGSLQARTPDLVVVGPGVLGRSPFEQAPLVALAASGCRVLLFQQSVVERLAGYPIASRKPSTRMSVDESHSLLRGIERMDAASWFISTDDDGAAPAVQLPLDEPVKEIIYWPREVPGDRQPAPIDVLLLSKTTGPGRLVLCQLPLGSFESDARSQLLLRNAIDYLLARPEPTLAPSKRASMPQPQSTSQPTIVIPSGVHP